MQAPRGLFELLLDCKANSVAPHLKHTKMTSKAMSAFRKTAETFIAGAKTLPRRYLISPEVFAREQERIFPPSPKAKV